MLAAACCRSLRQMAQNLPASEQDPFPEDVVLTLAYAGQHALLPGWRAAWANARIQWPPGCYP